MDWALLPLSTKGYLVRWSWESEVRFHGACRLDRARTFAFAQANIHLANDFSDEPAAPSSLNK